MQRIVFAGVTSLALLLLLLTCPTLSAQETAIPVLNSAAFPGTAIGDICYDPFSNQVYVLDLNTFDTHTYTATLGYLGVTPAAFPPNEIVYGITTDPASGAVIWATSNGLTGLNSIYASITVGAVPTFIANIASPTLGTVFGIDAAIGFAGTLLINDISGSAHVSDYFGTALIPPTPLAPVGASFGISHLGGVYSAHSTQTVGTAGTVVDNLFLTDLSTGLPVDNVGVLLSPSGNGSFGIDYGAMTAAGANTLYYGDQATNSIVHTTIQRTFIRGDANSDGVFNVADAIFMLVFKFQGGSPPTCPDAADTNDDGICNISDVLALLNGLFAGAPIPAPSVTCGFDPTPDANRCLLSSGNCP